MSGARPVPETRSVVNETPWATLRDAGARRLLVDAGLRLRVADGFSHARSLAFVVSLLVIQGVVAIVGTASLLGRSGLGDAARRIIQVTAPGAVGEALTTAVDQARSAGRSGSLVALGLALTGSLVTATTGMGQVQRGLNRIYGIERDRPTMRKYGLALILALTSGVVITAAFICIALGDSLGQSIADNPLTPIWGAARIPAGIVLAAVAVTLLFRWCPRRRQPGWQWTMVGSGVAVLLWTLTTVALSQVFALSPSFGDAYGPLAGIVALQLWSILSSIALLYGAAVSAQLEAVRVSQSYDDLARIPLGKDAIA